MVYINIYYIELIMQEELFVPNDFLFKFEIDKLSIDYNKKSKYLYSYKFIIKIYLNNYF